MNAFTEAAVTEAAVPETTELSYAGLVANFLAGRDGISGDYTSVGGVLSEDGETIARRTPDGMVIMQNGHTSETEFDDALIAGLALSGTRYRRMSGFRNLLSSAHRVRDVENPEMHEDFKAVASLFGFEYTQAELDSIALATNFKARVSQHFNDLAAKERARVAEEQKKMAAERAAREAITWDTGAGRAVNSSVSGSGGGQRLRIRTSGAKPGTRVETSTGNLLTLNQARKAFEFASRYWHGGQKINTYRNYETMSASTIGGAYSAQVYADKLYFGCQTVTRQEAERFADTQGWTRATPTTRTRSR